MVRDDWFACLLLLLLNHSKFAELDEIAQLLQLDNQMLFNCLTRLGDNWAQLEPDGTEIDASYASRIKFTLCRTLYGRLFTWIVSRVNDALKLKTSGTVGSRGKTIGLLDFYGFEALEKNTFDQFAINYCNERLQQVGYEESQADDVTHGSNLFFLLICFSISLRAS